MSFLTFTTRLLVAALATTMVTGCGIEDSTTPNSSVNRIIGAEGEGGAEAAEVIEPNEAGVDEENAPVEPPLDEEDPEPPCEDGEDHEAFPEDGDEPWADEEGDEEDAPYVGDEEEAPYVGEDEEEAPCGGDGHEGAPHDIDEEGDQGPLLPCECDAHGEEDEWPEEGPEGDDFCGLEDDVEACDAAYEACIASGDEEDLCEEGLDACIEPVLAAFDDCEVEDEAPLEPPIPEDEFGGDEGDENHHHDGECPAEEDDDGFEPELDEIEEGVEGFEPEDDFAEEDQEDAPVLQEEEAPELPAEDEAFEDEMLCLDAQDLCLEAAADDPELADVCIRAADSCMAGLTVGEAGPEIEEINEADEACYEALDGCLIEGADPELCFEAVNACLGD